MKKSIWQSTLYVTLITFGIKVLGLIKQSVLAACCGANSETDGFFVATGIIVNLCTIIFSSLSISLLTMHTNRLLSEGREAANQLINAVLRVFIPIAAVISIIFFWGAVPISHFFAPSYTAEKIIQLSRYVRIMSVSFVFWCYFLTVNVVLEADKIFVPGKFQGFFQNCFLIFAAAVLYQRFGIEALVYAFLLSGLCECILVTWAARKTFKLLFCRLYESKEIRKLITISVPLIVGNAIYEINDIVDKQISTGLGAGNASYLTYGSTINEIVTGVIVASVSTVLFANFASWIAEGAIGEVEKNLTRVMEYLTILLIPIMVMCIVAGDQIVEILYGRGSFRKTEVMETYGVVLGYAAGFVFQTARANIVKVYYAFQDTKTPMINGAIAVGINIVLSIFLSKIIGVSGIALATSIAMLLVTILLTKNVKKYLPGLSLHRCLGECIKSLAAGIIATGFVWCIRRLFEGKLYAAFVIEGLACVCVYVLAMWLLKSKSLIGLGNKVFAIIKR